MNESNDSSERIDPHAAEDKANDDALIIERQHFVKDNPIAISDIWINGERFVRATDPESSETVIRDFLKRLAVALGNVETTRVLLEGEAPDDDDYRRPGAALWISRDGDWSFETRVYGFDDEEPGYIASKPVQGDKDRATVTDSLDQDDPIERLLEVLGLKSFLS